MGLLNAFSDFCGPWETAADDNAPDQEPFRLSSKQIV